MNYLPDFKPLTNPNGSPILGVRHCAVAFDDLKRLGVSVVPLVIIIAPDGTIAAMAGAQAIDFEKEVQSLLAK